MNAVLSIKRPLIFLSSFLSLLSVKADIFFALVSKRIFFAYVPSAS
jgi:hypothetical protein